MKHHLQKLWKHLPSSFGPCPLPDAKSVQKRVDTLLNQSEPARKVPMKRPLRYALIAAAVLFVLVGTSVAAVNLSEYNVLNRFFLSDGNSELAESLVNNQVYSVSDENYTLTVPSSVADHNQVYFTVLIEAKTDEARQHLAADDFEISGPSFHETESHDNQLIIKTSWLNGSYSGGSEVQETDHSTIRTIDMDMDMGFGLFYEITLRYEAMKEGVQLKIPVKPIREIKLNIDADGQGFGTREHYAGGPVHLNKAVLTPLSIYMDFDSSYETEGQPLPVFLMKDGTFQTFGQLWAIGPNGSGSDPKHKYDWQFRKILDIPQVEALVFDGTAYPLDGGTPYEADTSTLIQPFFLTHGDMPEGWEDYPVPIFALCEGLGISCDWNEASRTAVMTFRGVTISLTEGDANALADGVPSEMFSAPFFQDGELWADVTGILRTSWGLISLRAVENEWESFEQDSGFLETTAWVIIP